MSLKRKKKKYEPKNKFMKSINELLPPLETLETLDRLGFPWIKKCEIYI
jgi:hypothetical protein